MAYFPKQTITILETNPGEFIYEKSRKAYKGKYIKTSTGQYYAGDNPLRLGPPIIKNASINLSFGRTANTHKYHILNNSHYNKLKKYKPLNASKTLPTEKDYERGYYTRYYVVRKNKDSFMFEISKETFDNFQKDHDFILYEIGSLTWSITEDAEKINQMNLEKIRKTVPQIENIFNTLDEFSIIHQQSNLYTEGKELYYEDATEYIGYYHIHLEEGPMVGRKHTKQPHAKLYFREDMDFPTIEPSQQVTSITEPTITEEMLEMGYEPPSESPESTPPTGGNGKPSLGPGSGAGPSGY